MASVPSSSTVNASFIFKYSSCSLCACSSLRRCSSAACKPLPQTEIQQQQQQQQQQRQQQQWQQHLVFVQQVYFSEVSSGFLQFSCSSLEALPDTKPMLLKLTAMMTMITTIIIAIHISNNRPFSQLFHVRLVYFTKCQNQKCSISKNWTFLFICVYFKLTKQPL